MKPLEKLLAIIFGLGLAAVIVLVLNFIPYLLWNKVVAPSFDWPQAGFWKVFFICWAVSWAARLIRGGK